MPDNWIFDTRDVAKVEEFSPLIGKLLLQLLRAVSTNLSRIAKLESQVANLERREHDLAIDSQREAPQPSPEPDTGYRALVARHPLPWRCSCIGNAWHVFSKSGSHIISGSKDLCRAVAELPKLHGEKE